MSDWIKVFNSLRSHPKIVRAGDRAAWLYVCGLCYSNEHLTDGFLAEDVLVVVGPGVKQPEKLAAALASVGLWHRVESGWQIHDYADVQRTASQIREHRDKDRKRKARTDSTATPERIPRGIQTESERIPRVEESREEKRTPQPPDGGAVVKFDRKPVPDARLDLAVRVLVEVNEQAGTSYGAYTGNQKPSENLKRIIGALTRRPDLTFEWAQRAINHQLNRPDRFWDGPPHAGHIFGDGVLDQLLEATKSPVPVTDRQDRFRSLQGRIA